MMWRINKAFEFCYGHKVHSQVLDNKMALTSKCKCRHLHGHEAKVVVHLEAGRLNNEGMVTDFNHLNWLKEFINETIDHKFLIDANDPDLELMSISPSCLRPANWGCPYKIYIAGRAEAHPDYYDSFVFVDFVPTSENLARWIYQIIKKKMADFQKSEGAREGGSLFKITSVEWWETPKSKSVYITEE